MEQTLAATLREIVPQLSNFWSLSLPGTMIPGVLEASATTLLVSDTMLQDRKIEDLVVGASPLAKLVLHMLKVC
jgi:hypothetical protein